MRINRFLPMIAALGLLFTTALPVIAASGSSSSSSSSSSRSSSSGGSGGSSGYSRPSTPSTPSTSNSGSGYTRPAAATPPATVSPPKPTTAAPTTSTNSGYGRGAAAPPPTTASTPPPPASTGGYGRGPGTAAAVGAAGVAGGAAVATAPASATPKTGTVADAQRRSVSTASLDAYKAERATSKVPPQVVKPAEVRRDPVYNSARSSFGGDSNTYMRQRETSYREYRTRSPEVFVVTQNMQPNYGMYDSSFLTGMMVGAIGTSMYDRATWMASQQHQPWYGSYRADLEKQARDNAELREKLAAMDREIATIKASGKPLPAATALPSGVDATVAIAPEAVIADATDESSSWGFVVVMLLIVAIGAIAVIWFLSNRRRR